jgi:hypothetical protein
MREKKGQWNLVIRDDRTDGPCQFEMFFFCGKEFFSINRLGNGKRQNANSKVGGHFLNIWIFVINFNWNCVRSYEKGLNWKLYMKGKKMVRL